MSIQQTIEEKLSRDLNPLHLQVINESHRHNVPPGSESHFKVVIVTPAFDGLSRVKRHMEMNRILADELKGPVHALSMETLTEEEWRAKGGEIMASPPCLGGSKADA